MIANAATFPIVGVGASAGGLEAFTQLLTHLPLDTGMGFVLVQHLDPEHESALVQILGRATSLPVQQITSGQRVEPNHVYVIPPNADLTIQGGVLELRPRQQGRTPHRPIDAFLESLAQDRREQAIGIVLSGTASDGTLGLEAIKGEDGITFVQDDSAKHDSMPRSAVAAGCVDMVLAPPDIAKELGRIAKHPYLQPPSRSSRGEDDRAEATAHEDDGSALPSGGGSQSEIHQARPGADLARARTGEDGYKRILLLLRNHSGVDFSLYKSTTIQRRVHRRLVLNKQNTLDDYAGFLRGNAKELDTLYSDVLISVTSFFRNPEMFDALQRDVFRRLLERRGDEPIRVWVLGCSTGQEAYSIAMAFTEAAEKAPRMRNLQVFATDLNESLLDKARHGLYAKGLAADLTPLRLRRFFVEEEGGYRVTKSLREMVVFARQNIIADPPFSRMDVISCRNLLIYLEPTLQRKALPTFHYALKPEGFLLLGASESVGGFTHLFEPLDRKNKIYVKKPAPTPALHLPLRYEHAPEPMLAGRRLPGTSRQPTSPDAPAGLKGEISVQREADRVTVKQFSPPAVLIDDALEVLQFRGPTEGFLQPPSGKASFDVLKMAREGLMLPLRSAISQARQDNTTVERNDVRVEHNGRTRTVRLTVVPLKQLRERCFLVLFEDGETAAGGGGRPARLPKAVEHAGDPAPPHAEEESSRIVALESELADTRDYLQSMQEQHEAANEELQAANEEVQSANEELQSVNEELETSKEELESANEELITVNEEMSKRNIELNRLYDDLVNLQTSTKLPIVLLGRDLTIRRFSQQAEKLLDLLAADVQRPIRHVQHGFSLADTAETLDLEGLAAEVIAAVREEEREVRDKSGRWHLLRVRPYLTVDNRVEGAVLVLTDIDAIKRGEEAVAESEARYHAMFAATSVGVSEADPDTGRLVRVNDRFAEMLGYPAVEITGKTFQDLTHPAEAIANRERLLGLVRGQSDCDEIETRLVRKDGTVFWAHITTNVVGGADGRPRFTVAITLDVTERKRAEEVSARLAAIVTSSDDAIIGTNLNGIVTDWNAGAQRIFGYVADEILGKSTALLIPPDRPDEEPEMLERIRRGEAVANYETIRRRKDGSMLDVALAMSPIHDTRGRVIGAAKIARDISERKQVESEHRARRAAEEASRAKDEFLALLSHELRNPLSAVRNAISSARVDSANRERALEIASRQSEHLTRLVDDLLDVARITQGKIRLRRERVALRHAAARAIESVRPLLDARGHTLSLACSADPVVDADPDRLEQIIENLLTNATKYTPSGGQIAVEIEQLRDDAILRVRDNGMGIPEDLLSRVFDLFAQQESRLDRAPGGLGIGLTIVRRLVELHGGRIDVRSEGLDRGAEFVVRLPALAAVAAPEPGPSRTPDRVAPARILLVEDNPEVAESLRMYLEFFGHRVRVASDGPAALAAVRGEPPDVALVDIGLPGMTGYELARHLREQPRMAGVPLVALSGYGSEQDKAQALAAGFDLHLTKPVDVDDLQVLLVELKAGDVAR